MDILKAEKAKTRCRLITGAPVDLAVLGSRLYEDQNDKFTSIHTHFHSQLGMSKFHRGWHRLAEKFRGRRKIVEADAKQWDSGMRGRLLAAIYRMRWNALRPEDRTWANLARHELYKRELINSIVLLQDGSLWAVNGGNKSGSVNTAHDNTLGHIIICMYSWLMCGGSIRAFWEHVFSLYGDDFLSADLPDDFFIYYRQTGIKLPPENVKVHDRLEDASFLSQSFRQCDGAWVAVPDHTKTLWSAITTDLRRCTPELTYQRLYMLWLDSFYTPLEPSLFSAVCGIATEIGVQPPSRSYARLQWIGDE